VGGGRTVEVDVRVIAATSRDLRRAIQRGELREDLFFRLSVVPLHVPPLRDRPEDLEPLVHAILARIRATDGRTRSLSPAAWARLRAHHWPGNIRELESVLRRATILEEADELRLEGLDAPTEEDRSQPPESARQEGTWPTLEEHERAYIERVLELKRGVIEGARGAARLLGVPSSTLRSRMKRLGISAHSTRANGRNQR
jgi:DNA-binding NtrC family response regulator